MYNSETNQFMTVHYNTATYKIKLRMEMRNVPKRQQPDHRADNSRRTSTGLQCNEYVYTLLACGS